MVTRILSRAKKPELETFEASPSPLRLIFKSLHLKEPVVVVIVGINDFKTESLCISLTLVLSYLILFHRIDVGIAIINNGSDPVIHHGLDDCARARCAAGVEKNFCFSQRRFYDILLLLHDYCLQR